MPPTTILIDDAPCFVVRPTDQKALARFLRNRRAFLLAEAPEARLGHRPADEAEVARWRAGLALHLAWGGEEENFFGLPL